MATRTRTCTTLVAAGGLLVAGTLAACAPDEPTTTEPDAGATGPEDDPEPAPDPDDDPDRAEGTDPEDGEPLDEGAAGVLLAAMPDCGWQGDTVTFTAEGLEADEEHVLRFDDEPTEDASLDRATPVTSDGDGAFEVDLSLPEDAPLVRGEYEVDLLTTDGEGEADGFLISVPFELTEDCPAG